MSLILTPAWISFLLGYFTPITQIYDFPIITKEKINTIAVWGLKTIEASNYNCSDDFTQILLHRAFSSNMRGEETETILHYADTESSAVSGIFRNIIVFWTRVIWYFNEETVDIISCSTRKHSIFHSSADPLRGHGWSKKNIN